MFVTLSRRNTSLINQQLGLIETLESDEEDPQRLESLFRLDHLASRMRRNAESLVILSGAPTRATEQDDLSLTDVLQAAIAGVQDYRRVQLDAAPAQRVSGEASADVVHLLVRAGRQRPVVLAAELEGHGDLVVHPRWGHRPGDRRRTRHRRGRAVRAQREAAGRWRGHARHRSPDGPVRGQPARPAARPHGPARPQRPDGHHRHGVPADQRPVRHRSAGGRLGRRPGHRARCAPRPSTPTATSTPVRRVRRERRAGGRRRGRLPSARAGARAGPRLRPDHGRDQRLRPAAASPRCLGCRQRHRAGVDGWRLLRPGRLRGDGPEPRSRLAVEDDVVDAVVVETDEVEEVDAPEEEVRAAIALGPVSEDEPTDEMADEWPTRSSRRGRRDGRDRGRRGGRAPGGRAPRSPRSPTTSRSPRSPRSSRGRRGRRARRSPRSPRSRSRWPRPTTVDQDEVAEAEEPAEEPADEDHLAPVLAGLALAPSVPFDAQEATAGLTTATATATATRTATATVTREGSRPGCTASPPPPATATATATGPSRRLRSRSTSWVAPPRPCRRSPTARPARPRPWTRTRPRSSGRCGPTG